MSFALDLQKFANNTNKKVDDVIAKIVLDVGTSIVLKSPVGDGDLWASPPPPGYVGGRFRGNWQFGVGGIDTSVDGAIDPTGANSIGRIAAGIPEKTAGKVFYITNTLPYAQRLENGWSTQAPAGMVGLTIAEFEPIVAAAVAEFEALDLASTL